MSEKNGVVHLWDLPDDKVLIRLPKDMQKIMVETALEISKTRKWLAENLLVNRTSVSDFKYSRFRSISLNFVKRLSIFLVRNGFKKFSLDNLEKIIELVRSTKAGEAIRNPNFPINFNCKEGVQIISCIFFDGGVTSGSLNPFYFNKEVVLADQVIENVRKVVGDIYCSKNKNEEDVFEVLFPQILGNILVNGLGISTGQKVFKNPTIPPFITEANLDLQKAFLQQAFDDEGSVRKSGCRAVQLSQHSTIKEPPIRLIQLKEMIEKFGIRVNGPYFAGERKTNRGYTSYGWSIQITNQRDIRLFEEKINFSLDRQRKKLDELLNSYTEPPRFRRYTAPEEFLKMCEGLKNGNIKLTTKNISRKIGRKERYVRRILTKMVKANKLKVTKEWDWDGRGSLPKEFELVKRLDNSV